MILKVLMPNQDSKFTILVMFYFLTNMKKTAVINKGYIPASVRYM